MPLTGCQLGHLAEFKQSWPLNKDYSEHLNKRSTRPTGLTVNLSVIFALEETEGSLYGSLLFYLKPTIGWALFAWGFNNHKAIFLTYHLHGGCLLSVFLFGFQSLYHLHINFQNQRGKTDNRQPSAFATYAISPTRTLGLQLPYQAYTELWSPEVLDLCGSQSVRHKWTSSTHSMGWAYT